MLRRDGLRRLEKGLFGLFLGLVFVRFEFFTVFLIQATSLLILVAVSVHIPFDAQVRVLELVFLFCMHVCVCVLSSSSIFYVPCFLFHLHACIDPSAFTMRLSSLIITTLFHNHLH